MITTEMMEAAGCETSLLAMLAVQKAALSSQKQSWNDYGMYFRMEPFMEAKLFLVKAKHKETE